MLRQKLMQYAQNKPYPFHMPGHKGNTVFMPDFGLLAKCDITEIDGFDNLQNPDEILLELEDRWTTLLGSKKSFISVNGSTAGNIAAILAAAGEGDTVITGRNCHKSVYSALTFSGAAPFYVMPDVGGRITPEALLNAFEQKPNAKAVVVTSPDYYGALSDVKALSEICRKRGAALIIDEAHGSHLYFSPFFPDGAIKLGADIVINSSHKTLPSLTQTSIVSVCGDYINPSDVKKALNMVQTTSPSYILMASLSYCAEFLANNISEFEIYTQRLKQFRKNCAKFNNISLRQDNEFYDESKLVFGIKGKGNFVANTLRREYNIELEMRQEDIALAMTSVMDTAEGFDRLFQALAEIDKNMPHTPKYDFNTENYAHIMPKVEKTLRQAYFSKSKFAPLEEARGKISAEFITPYPPGIPLFAIGERITDEGAALLKKLIDEGKNVVGVSKNRLISVLSDD